MQTDPQLEKLFQDILNFRPRVKDLRRTQVISAVIDLIAEKGIDEVTFESVGKKVGMARSHVVYYYKDRDAMIESAVQFVGYSAQHIISEQLSGVEKWDTLLAKYIEANFDWLKKYPKHASVMLLLYYQASFKKKYQKFHSEIREVGAKRLEAILKMSPFGKRSPAAKVKSLARSVQGLLSGNLLDALTTQDKNYSKAKNETLEAVKQLVR